MTIRVLIVDDQVLVRRLLTAILEQDPEIEVVAQAADPHEARTQIKKHHPDVITLDVEMPKMDGVTFLKNLMRLRPMPVVMISTLTQKGAPTTLEAMEIGAVDYVAKPSNTSPGEMEAYSEEIISKVKAAASARVRKYVEPIDGQAASGKLGQQNWDTSRLIAIGASTGGTEAIREVLQGISANCPPIVVTQHIPAEFSGSFAERLNRQCPMNVHHAEHGMPIRPGNAYIAPGGQHLEVAGAGQALTCKLTDEDPVNRHRPSVDVLFDSVVSRVGKRAMGVILTGMGADGARGLLKLRENGSKTFAQDRESSVVWGMPGAAVSLEAADQVLALQNVAAALAKEAHAK